MRPYTLDNNFSFQYGGKLFDWSDKSMPMTCHYAKAGRGPLSFKDECITTIQLIRDQARELGRVPRLLLSGGFDSEIVLRSALEAGVECHPIVFRFANNLNSHEMHFIDILQKKFNLDIEYFDLDIAAWVKTQEAEKMAIDSGCDYYEMLPHMLLMERVWQTGGLPILANGDLYVKKVGNPIWRMTGRGDPFSWMYIEYEYILAWFRFAIKRNILGGLAFFQHTPEMTLSMLNEPEMDDCVNDRLPGKLSARSSKYAVYKRYWPDMIDRPKWNGGEKVHSVYNLMKIRMKAYNLPVFDDEWKMPVIDFKRMITND